MEKLFRFCLAFLFILYSLQFAYSQPDESKWEEVKLKSYVFKDINFKSINKDSKKPISGAIPLANKKGSGFNVEMSPSNLKIDLEGGDNLSKKIALKGEIVTLNNVKFSDGSFGKYSVSITSGNRGAAWFYSRACGMTGTYNNTTFVLIDDNTNGIFNEKGNDGILFMNDSKFVVPFSDTVLLGTKLYYVKANETGTSIFFQEYTGKTGQIDLTSSFKAKGKLTGLVIQGKDCWFDVTKPGTHTVPAGSYKIYCGGVEKGKLYCSIENGEMPAMEVKEGDTLKLTLGTKYDLIFNVSQEGTKITVNSNGMHIKGQAGEIYTDFGPNPITPKIYFREEKSKKEVCKGKFCLG